ncbi:NAD-P-binding protein [Massarina eburnea CBS 473.64]|uniref:NAD-P-binding protein n=1 Tax=Massarina eburnea CBS 473.64 TaxID=1395130 RepID=A0A6A6RMP1_9PLEO|nr:NAD-P-binding protein [Massarina eburnea CBS 473.64]
MTSPTSNSTWTIPKTATSISNLTKTTIPLPTPGPHQVLLRILATSLNYRDILIASRSPAYPGDHKPDLTPLSDGAGVIHSTHPTSEYAGREGSTVVVHPNAWLTGDVRNLDLSDVYGSYAQDGILTEWKIVDDERVIVSKNVLGLDELASLPTAGVTAWSAIRECLDGTLSGEIREWTGGWKEKRLAGKTVLTQGTGGVSSFGIQIAAALGATVIATSSSDAKLELAKSLGATHLINYNKTPDWDKEVLRLTNGKGVDHVIEVGGAQTLMKSLNSTRPGGLVSVIGILSEAEKLSEEFLPAVLFGGKIVKGCVAFSRDMTAEFVSFVEEHGIKPVIAKTFEFDQAIEAFDALQKQNAVGKIIIRIGQE